VIALRGKITAIVDDKIGPEQARVRIALTSGKSHETFIERARGSLQRPMTDAELDAKFRSLAASELDSAQIDRLAEQCWALAKQSDAAAIARGSHK
jgi:2-methylcitrate dehydratase PrpD